MKARKQFAVAVMVLLMLVPLISYGGRQNIRRFYLYGATTDTTQQVTRWFPVRGAAKVLIRTSSNTSLFSTTDSVYCDSIGVFQVLTSDSVSFIAGNFTYAADSVVITSAGATTDSIKGIGMNYLPVLKVLYAGATGSGRYTQIYPLSTNSSIEQTFAAQWMRIKFTPNTRLTFGGLASTQGIRTQGIRGLRMDALVIYDNE